MLLCVITMQYILCVLNKVLRVRLAYIYTFNMTSYTWYMFLQYMYFGQPGNAEHEASRWKPGWLLPATGVTGAETTSFNDRHDTRSPKSSWSAAMNTLTWTETILYETILLFTAARIKNGSKEYFKNYFGSKFVKTNATFRHVSTGHDHTHTSVICYLT